MDCTHGIFFVNMIFSSLLLKGKFITGESTGKLIAKQSKTFSKQYTCIWAKITPIHYMLREHITKEYNCNTPWACSHIYLSMRLSLISVEMALGVRSPSLNTLSITDSSVLVVSRPQKAIQSLTHIPAPITSLPLFTVPACITYVYFNLISYLLVLKQSKIKYTLNNINYNSNERKMEQAHIHQASTLLIMLMISGNGMH